MRSLLIIFVVLFCVNFCLGEPNPPPPQHPCRPSEQTKSNCLYHGCFCGWCILSHSGEFHGAGKLSEHNRNRGPLGKCFEYNDNLTVNIKNCGNINATIHTYANSKYCKNVSISILVFAYAACVLSVGGVVVGIIIALIWWLRNCR